ncbi:Pr6Pr family membrane protein [Pseudomonas sp. RIT-To-2]|uniref:Pr6Pr family membrane protein n=1 Tax=Pseudomonas sp. RIT-To-2 TaxID=3462541 RepID=UPI0024139E51
MPPSLPSRPLHLFVTTAAWVAWLALTVQLLLILQARLADQASLVGGVLHFFGYFTILTNTLVAAVLTAAARHEGEGAPSFWLRPWVSSGVAASIILVGLAYSLLLRNTWNPQGVQWVVNELLHDIMPPVFVVFWWWCVPKGTLQVRHVVAWSVYPVAYFGYCLLRGNAIGVYPYPFIDVGTLGYGRVLVNALAILLGFVIISLLLVGLDRWRGKRQRQVAG